MFASLQSLQARAAFRAADLIDLVIELATLGEYGLEYPDPVAADSRRTIRDCPADNRRLDPTRSRPSPRRNPNTHRTPCRHRGLGRIGTAQGDPGLKLRRSAR